jgi:hypothetical protein
MIKLEHELDIKNEKVLSQKFEEQVNLYLQFLNKRGQKVNPDMFSTERNLLVDDEFGEIF